MTKTTSIALFFLAAGIFTSVTVLSAYQILIVIPLVYYTYFAIKDSNWKLPTSAWWLLAFAITALVSLTVNFDVIPKPSKNFGRVKYFLFAIASIYVFRVWVNDVNDKTKKILLNTFIITIIGAASYMIYKNFIQTWGRVRGLTSIMRYGYGSAMIILPLASAVLQRKKIGTWFNWKLVLMAVIFGFIGMYITQTRGAMLGLFCGIPFMLYFWRPKIGLTVGGIFLVLVLALAGNYFFGKGTDTTTHENRLLMNKNNMSDNIRMSQWKAAVIATKERPLLGWGLSNFHSQLKRIKYDYDLDAKDYNDAHSHNLFLEIASGTGIIGLFFFLGWVITWAIEAFKAGGLIRALVVPFGVGFVVSSQFEVTFDANNASMIFFIYSLSSSFSLREKNQN